MTGWNESLALKGNIVQYTIDGNTVDYITNIGTDVLDLSLYPNITTNNQPRNGVITLTGHYTQSASGDNLVIGPFGLGKCFGSGVP